MSADSKLEINAINDALSATFAALADPTRRAMLSRLSQGEASINELAAPFKMSLPAVSKHIKVLEKAGLLTKTINAQQRPCKIDGVQLKQAVDWIDQYKQLWEGRLDRLDVYLVELHASEVAEKAAKKISTKKTTKKIAHQATNTPAIGENSLKKQAKLGKALTKSTKPPKATPTPKEKPHDNNLNDPNNVQQQIGFDF